jgi:hypothetical protein
MLLRTVNTQYETSVQDVTLWAGSAKGFETSQCLHLQGARIIAAVEDWVCCINVADEVRRWPERLVVG